MRALLAAAALLAAPAFAQDLPLCANLYVDAREVTVSAELESEDGERQKIAPVAVKIHRKHLAIVQPPLGWRFISFSVDSITRTARDFGGRMPQAFCLHYAEPLKGVST